MDLSRRSFLHAGGMLGLAALAQSALAPLALAGQRHKNTDLGSGVGFVVPRQTLNDPLYLMTREMFTENLYTKFAFSLGGVKLGYFVLVDVIDTNPDFVPSNPTSVRECFSLVFQGPKGLPLRQETYTITHGKLGTFQLLMVPGAVSGPGPHYEAVINRVFP
jgi:hypothetical protein